MRRLVLGIAQMISAIAALLLILTMGLRAVALTVVVITCVLTTLSVLLFGSRNRGARG
jgi:hypothetical protein